MKKQKYVYQTYSKSYFDESTNQLKFQEITEKRIKSPREIKLGRIMAFLIILSPLLGTTGIVSMAIGEVMDLPLMIIIGMILALLIIPMLVLLTEVEYRKDTEDSKHWQPFTDIYIEHNEQEQKRCEEWRRAHPIEETARKIMEDNNSVELAHIIQEFLKNNKGE